MSLAKTVAIVLNAPELTTPISEPIIICADGGRNLLPASTQPFAVVGDMDSIKMVNLTDEQKLICPKEKNYTDGERAVRFAVEQGFNHLVIYGATGGRADHCYANLSLLALANELGVRAEIKTGQEHILYATKGQVAFNVRPTTTISVLPFSDTLRLDNSQGLYYPFRQLTLDRIHSVGISNVATSDCVRFDILHGSALIFISTNLV